MPVKLGELLLKENMISPPQLQEALQHQKMNGGKLGKSLVSLGYVRDEDITALLSRQYGVPSINLDHFEVDPAVIKLIPAETARKYQILPLSRSGATLTIAMADPTNVFAMDDIKFMTGYNVEPVVASESALEEAAERYYGSARSLTLREGGSSMQGMGLPSAGNLKEVIDAPQLTFDDMAGVGLHEVDLDAMGEADADVETVKEADEEIDLGNLARSSEAAPVIKLTNVLLVDSLKRGASDIHIEPYEKTYRIRFRIDGILMEVMRPNLKLKDPLTSRVKILAKLNIAEKRLPQDGRIKLQMNIEGRQKRHRLPRLVPAHAVRREDRAAAAGQRQAHAGPHQARLRAREPRGLGSPDLQALRHGAGDRPHRLGQDQHALLGHRLAQQARHQHHDGRGPGRVQPAGHQPGADQGADRPELRRRPALVPAPGPNIILVGEIRDYETAEIAVKASLTGHLVLSTLHTNDAPSSTINAPDEHGRGALPGGHLRQHDPGPAPGAAGLRQVQGGRSTTSPAKTLIEVGFTPEEVGKGITSTRAVGCEICNGSAATRAGWASTRSWRCPRASGT